ncbi:MAG: DUF255 domain-containing protein [Bacteroidota bacterium]
MVIFLLHIIALFNVSSSPDISREEPLDIQWYTWEEAHELSKTAPKKIFIDLYTDWCGWCKRMDATTFKDPAVVQLLNENFYPVKFNAEQRDAIVFNEKKYEYMNAGRRGVHQLAYALLDGRMGYPAFVTLDESFARIMISPGYKKSPQLIKELTFAKEEHYKSQSFDEYASAATGE